MQKKIEAVRRQYEKYPYPAIPWVATPGRNDLQTLIPPVDLKRNPRICVAGSGTFEPIVFAKAFPRSRVTAVDLSQTSLNRCLLRGLIARKFIHTVRADLHDDLSHRLGVFDYVACTGVLHHTPTPELMLSQIVKLMSPRSVLRLMIYADESREPVREVQKFFKEKNLTTESDDLFQKCHALIAELDSHHPFRKTFEHYTDSQTPSGLIDGFFHACENRLSLRTLRKICETNELQFLGTANADLKIASWDELAAIDTRRELSVNPVLWLQK